MTDESQPDQPTQHVHDVRLIVTGVVAPDPDEARRRVLRAIETGGLAHMQLGLTETGENGKPLGLTANTDLIVLEGARIEAEVTGPYNPTGESTTLTHLPDDLPPAA